MPRLCYVDPSGNPDHATVDRVLQRFTGLDWSGVATRSVGNVRDLSQGDVLIVIGEPDEPSTCLALIAKGVTVVLVRQTSLTALTGNPL